MARRSTGNKVRSRLGDKAVRQDHFHKRAKKEGFLARAVFKLQELDDQFHLFVPGQRVLDLGCAPGSWLQYAHGKVGPRGALVGLDRAELKTPLPWMRMLVGDVHTIARETLLGELAAFDVVLSDMAPDTIGIRNVDQARSEALFERALQIATETLAPGGHFVGKLFQGPDFKKLIDLCRVHFEVVKSAKPESSRQISIEQYIVAKGLKRT